MQGTGSGQPGIPIERLKDAFLKAKEATCLPSTMNTYRSVINRFAEVYITFPVTADEVIGFVGQQRRLGRRSKQNLYDVIGELYAWTKGYSALASRVCPTYPGSLFGGLGEIRGGYRRLKSRESTTERYVHSRRAFLQKPRSAQVLGGMIFWCPGPIVSQ